MLEDTFAATNDQGEALMQRTLASTVTNLQDFAEVEKRHGCREQCDKELEKLTK